MAHAQAKRSVDLIVPLIQNSLPCLPARSQKLRFQTEMAPQIDPMDWGDKEDNPSTTVDVDTRSTSELLLDVSGNTPKLPVRLINGQRSLIADQSANRRAGAKISSIWPYGHEQQLMDVGEA